jgi:hypothetical protein
MRQVSQLTLTFINVRGADKIYFFFTYINSTFTDKPDIFFIWRSVTEDFIPNNRG